MTSPGDVAAGLPELIDELRSTGHRVGVDQYVAAEALLLLLASRGALPADPARWRTLLGPVFCTSPEEQADFPGRFERWAGRFVTIPDRADAESIGGERPPGGLGTVRRLALAASALALTGVGAYTDSRK